MTIEKLRKDHSELVSDVMVDMDSAWAIVGNSFTYAICGINTTPWKESGEVWWLNGPDVKRNVIGVLKFTQILLNEEIKRLKIKCLLAYIEESQKVHIKFAKLMGMSLAGRLPSFLPKGKTALIMWRGEE